MNGNADDHLWSLLEKLSLEKRDSCYRGNYTHTCIGTLLSSKTYKKIHTTWSMVVAQNVGVKCSQEPMSHTKMPMQEGAKTPEPRVGDVEGLPSMMGPQYGLY